MKISEIINAIETEAPLRYQEDYDNSGLITGHHADEVQKALICLDVTGDVIDEAVSKKAEIIISHHPPVFEAMKKFGGNSHAAQIVTRAIRNNIALYAVHTNLDNSATGINKLLCDLIGLKNAGILNAQKGVLRKLVTFCPVAYADKVRQALFAVGAGKIGAYDSCSFNAEGQGSFRASDAANPFVGNKNELHFESEVRIETIFPVHLEKLVLNALCDAHPYEEVAYDVYALENAYPLSGSGMIGLLETPVDAHDFLKTVKQKLGLEVLRHSAVRSQKIQKVALCSGAGGGFVKSAISAGADVYLSAEFKHNHFVDFNDEILIADIGHFESEHFAKELIKSILIKKFPNFAAVLSEREQNPVYYL